MLLKNYLLKRSNKFRVSGVVHVGAHLGEELSFYKKFLSNPENVLWIEGDKTLAEQLQKRLFDYRVINTLVTKDGRDVQFNHYENSQTNSIFITNEHDLFYGKQSRISEIVSSRTLSDVIDEVDIDYNFLNIDVQGAELEVLMGCNYLNRFDYVYIEVNWGNVYDNIPLINEISHFLISHNFIRKKLAFTLSNWGDALYVKQKKINYFEKLKIHIIDLLLIRLVAPISKVLRLIRNQLSKKILCLM
jgi:FkbM family methyltransferase